MKERVKDCYLAASDRSVSQIQSPKDKRVESTTAPNQYQNKSLPSLSAKVRARLQPL